MLAALSLTGWLALTGRITLTDQLQHAREAGDSLCHRHNGSLPGLWRAVMAVKAVIQNCSHDDALVAVKAVGISLPTLWKKTISYGNGGDGAISGAMLDHCFHCHHCSGQ